MFASARERSSTSAAAKRGLSADLEKNLVSQSCRKPESSFGGPERRLSAPRPPQLRCSQCSRHVSHEWISAWARFRGAARRVRPCFSCDPTLYEAKLGDGFPNRSTACAWRSVLPGRALSLHPEVSGSTPALLCVRVFTKFHPCLVSRAASMPCLHCCPHAHTPTRPHTHAGLPWSVRTHLVSCEMCPPFFLTLHPTYS